METSDRGLLDVERFDKEPSRPPFHGLVGELDPYEELLGDAMNGDSFRFAREDWVEEAWRIVDPAIQAGTPVVEYAPGTWGPREAQEMIPGGWYVSED